MATWGWKHCFLKAHDDRRLGWHLTPGNASWPSLKRSPNCFAGAVSKPLSYDFIICFSERERNIPHQGCGVWGGKCLYVLCMGQPLMAHYQWRASDHIGRGQSLNPHNLVQIMEARKVGWDGKNSLNLLQDNRFRAGFRERCCLWIRPLVHIVFEPFRLHYSSVSPMVGHDPRGGGWGVNVIQSACRSIRFFPLKSSRSPRSAHDHLHDDLWWPATRTVSRGMLFTKHPGSNNTIYAYIVEIIQQLKLILDRKSKEFTFFFPFSESIRMALQESASSLNSFLLNLIHGCRE